MVSECIVSAKMVSLSASGTVVSQTENSHIRGAFGKYVAWSFFSVTDKQTHSCLVSF